MLFVLWFTYSDYLFGFFWSLCCLSFNLQLLITSLVSFGHYVVCPLIYRFWLPLWYLLIIMLFVLWFKYSDYLFGFFWSLCCQCFFDIRILIAPLVSFGHYVVSSSSMYGFWLPLWYLLANVLSVLLRYTDSDYTFGIFWPLCRLSFFDIRILNTPLVSFGHFVVCSSLIYRFLLPLWYLLAIVLSVLRYTDSDYPFGIFLLLCCQFFFDIGIRIYPFGIFWPLCCQFFFDIRILITPLVSFGHCVVFLLWYTDSDYRFGIFWSLFRLPFFDIQILITPLVSFGHCIVSSSSI